IGCKFGNAVDEKPVHVTAPAVPVVAQTIRCDHGAGKERDRCRAGRHLDAICYDIPVESGRIIIVQEPLFRD
ncbi:MAG TPA: hypothetical protein VHA53_01645, partial [Nitrolancea sp.]|nr:hypothetical protein [Nitrolancea sp.]